MFIISDELVFGQDEVARFHAIPEMMRILLAKTASNQVIFEALKLISALCVSTCYTPNRKNQTSMEKISAIPVLVDLLKKNANSPRFKSEIFYCMSMLCLNNPRNRKVLGKHLTRAGLSYDDVIKELAVLMSIGLLFK